jgi:hypothetical protein
MSATPAEATLGLPGASLASLGPAIPPISRSCVSLLPLYSRLPPAPVFLPPLVPRFHSTLRYIFSCFVFFSASLGGATMLHALRNPSCNLALCCHRRRKRWPPLPACGKDAPGSLLSPAHGPSPRQSLHLSSHNPWPHTVSAQHWLPSPLCCWHQRGGRGRFSFIYYSSILPLQHPEGVWRASVCLEGKSQPRCTPQNPCFECCAQKVLGPETILLESKRPFFRCPTETH